MPSLADIYLARGQAESNAALRRAAIESQRSQGNAQAWSGAIQNIGGIAANALQNYAQQKEQAPLKAEQLKQAQQQTQLQGMQIDDAQAQRADAALEPGRQQTLAQILAKARTTDPQTGAAMIDHTKLMDGLTAAGLQGRYEKLKPIIESYDKNSSEAATKQAAAMKDMAGIVADDGFSVDSFITGIDDLVGRGLMSETYAMPMIKRAQEDPKFVKGFTSRVLGIKEQGPLITKPGDIGRDPNDPTKVLFENPTNTPAPVGFTLGPNQKRYDAQGKLIASAPPSVPAGEQAAPARPVDLNAPHGEDFIKTIDPQRAAVIKSLAEGRQAWPSAMAMRTPYWQKLTEDVFQYDPTFDTATASNNARVKVRTDFTSGASAKQVNALNTVIGHLGTLTDAAEAMGNGDTQFLNTIKNWVSKQTGSPTVTNFETAKEAVASELVRVWRQAGGSTQDVQDWKKTLDSSQSMGQLRSNISTIGHLLESKIQSMQDQYSQGMGIAAIELLTPESRKALDKMEGKPPSGIQPRTTGQSDTGTKTATIGGVSVTLKKVADGWQDPTGAVYNDKGVRIR